MSPIDYIKKGIIEGNWETVCEGYERLTGQSLPIPFPTATIEDAENALKQIADIAMSVLDGPIAEICDTTVKTKKKKSSSSKKSSNKNVKRKATVTKDGEDSSLQLNDSGRTKVQKETGGVQLITNDPDPEEVESNKRRAARSRQNKIQIERQTTKTYDVKCNECQQPFSSDRPGGEMGQKCKKCLRNNKSRFV